MSATWSPEEGKLLRVVVNYSDGGGFVADVAQLHFEGPWLVLQYPDGKVKSFSASAVDSVEFEDIVTPHLPPGTEQPGIAARSENEGFVGGARD